MQAFSKGLEPGEALRRGDAGEREGESGRSARSTRRDRSRKEHPDDVELEVIITPEAAS